MHQDNGDALTISANISRHMTITDFAAYGADSIAYIKPVNVDGKAGYSIHAADGHELAIIDDRSVAEITVRQNDMEPFSVH